MHGARTSTFEKVDDIDTSTNAVTGTGSRQRTSLMDALTSVSKSITSVHTEHGTAAGKRSLREVEVVELPSDESSSYSATLMEMTQDEMTKDFKLTVSPDQVDRSVTVQTKAFAKGGQRLAFHMDIDGIKHVAKESKFDEDQQGQRRSHIDHFRTRQVADELLESFAVEIRALQAGCLGEPGKALENQEIRLAMLEGKIYRLTPLSVDSGEALPDAPHRYVYAELYLNGKIGPMKSKCLGWSSRLTFDTWVVSVPPWECMTQTSMVLPSSLL